MKHLILIVYCVLCATTQAQSLLYKRPTLDKDQAYEIHLAGDIYILEYYWLKSTYAPNREFFATLMLLSKNIDILDATYNRLVTYSNRFEKEEKEARIAELNKAVRNMHVVASDLLKSETYKTRIKKKGDKKQPYWWSYIDYYATGTVLPSQSGFIRTPNPKKQK